MPFSAVRFDEVHNNDVGRGWWDDDELGCGYRSTVQPALRSLDARQDGEYEIGRKDIHIIE
jgi:hypothetical protein